MRSLRKIWAVALYSLVHTLRSNSFRVYAVVSIFITFLANVFLVMQLYTRALSASIPYLTVLVFNTILLFAGPFVMAGVFNDDRRHDTTKTLHARPFTNAVYVPGKAVGVIVAFLGVLAADLLIGFIFNAVLYDDSPLSPACYLFYPLLGAAPALIFILGVSFLLGVLIRSQVILTVMLPLLLLFVYSSYGTSLYGLSDAIVYHIPFMYSDIAGFADGTALILHRAMYLSLGLGMLALAAFLFRTTRLPQSKAASAGVVTAALFFFAVSFLAGKQYISHNDEGIALRERVRALNAMSAGSPNVSVSDMSLDLTHHGSTITVTSTLTVTNTTDSTLDSCRFTLNPTLTVESVKRGGESLPWNRELYLLTVIPSKPLVPGASDSLTIRYAGTVDDRICYADIPEDDHARENTMFVYSLGKRYGYITPSYVLLTRESMWYPAATIPSGSEFPAVMAKDFSRYRLTVRAEPGLTVISQGDHEEDRTGVHVFEPETPLPQLSLVIGRYERKSVTVDGIEYSLYTRHGHDAIFRYLDKLDSEDVREIISEVKRDIEYDLKLTYPYRRLSLIETPVHFLAHHRFWQLDPGTNQPEQVLLPECGALLPGDQLDIKKRIRGYGENRYTQKYQREFLKSVLNDTFHRENREWSRIVARRATLRSSQSLERKTYVGSTPSFIHAYNLFPQFYSFINDIMYGEFSLFALSLGYTLKERLPHNDYFGWGGPTELGVTRALSRENLVDMCYDSSFFYELFDVMRIKAEELFKRIEIMVGRENFDAFLQDILAQSRFRTVDGDVILRKLEGRFGIDLVSLLSQWQTEQRFPKFTVTDTERTRLEYGGKMLYQYRFTVTNIGQVAGVLTVRLDSPYGDPPIVRDVLLEPGQSKEIGMIDTLPRAIMMIYTYNALNPLYTPLKMYGTRLVKDAEPFDGESIIQSPIVRETGIVVDNADSGFVIISQPTEKLAARLVSQQDSQLDILYPFIIKNPPRRWHELYFQEFYGSLTTALWIAAGTGDAVVSWSANLPDEGDYEVFVFMQEPKTFRDPRYREDSYLVKDFTYRIHHDGGVDEVPIKADKAVHGWNSLGFFTLSQGIATVELSNVTKGKLVYADAVKWVKKP